MKMRRNRSSDHLHVIITDDADGLSEHMGEAFSFGRFSRVPTEQLLVNVPLKIGLADEVVCAEHHSLEVRPKALNAIGVDAVGTDELLSAVANVIVTETFLGQTTI